MCLHAALLMLQGEPGSAISGGGLPGRKGEPGIPGIPVRNKLESQCRKQLKDNHIIEIQNK